MAERRITYDNELEIMIEDYLANPLEAELDRIIEGLAEEELAERRAKVQSVLEGREKFEIPSAQVLHNIMEVWRAFRPSVYKKLKRMDIMPLEAERLLQEQGRIKSKLPYNRETTDMFTLIGKDQDPLNEYPEHSFFSGRILYKNPGILTDTGVSDFLRRQEVHYHTAAKAVAAVNMPLCKIALTTFTSCRSAYA